MSLREAPRAVVAVSPETRVAPLLPLPAPSVHRSSVRMFCYGSEDGREPSLGQRPASEGARVPPAPRVISQTGAAQEAAFCVLWAAPFEQSTAAVF